MLACWQGGWGQGAGRRPGLQRLLVSLVYSPPGLISGHQCHLTGLAFGKSCAEGCLLVATGQPQGTTLTFQSRDSTDTAWGRKDKQQQRDCDCATDGLEINTGRISQRAEAAVSRGGRAEGRAQGRLLSPALFIYPTPSMGCTYDSDQKPVR